MGIVEAQDVEPVRRTEGRYQWTRRQLGAAAGGQWLGCSLYELPVGAADFPMHHHLGNEEAVYVLEGTGVVRSPDGDVPVRPGSYAAFPVESDRGHQVVNTGTAPLRYLAISTMRAPDVMLYPEKGAFGVVAGAAPGGSKQARTFEGHFPLQQSVPYWQ